MRWLTVFAALVLVPWATPAKGGDFRDPTTGFSFSYPDSWIAVANPGKDIDQGMFPAEIRGWLKKNNVSLSRVNMALIRNGQDEFLENVNVVVDRQQMPVNNSTVKKLMDVLPQQYRSMGAAMENVEGRVQKLGANEVIVLDYRVQLPGVAMPLRQRQVFFPGGGNTFIVTCTARADSFANYSQTFENILASFKAPAPVTGGFDWNRTLTMAIIGGVIGGLIGLIKKFTAKKKPESNKESPEAGLPSGE